RGPRTRLALRQPFALLGRDPRADVVLDDAQVSARHAYLQVLAGRPVVFDLYSRKGTRRASVPVPRGSVLGREPLEVGPFLVRLVRGDGTAEPGGGAEAGPPPGAARGGPDLPRVW